MVFFIFGVNKVVRPRHPLFFRALQGTSPKALLKTLLTLVGNLGSGMGLMPYLAFSLTLLNLIMATYTIEISSEDALSEHWTDPNHPTKSFKFNENSFDECTQLANGNHLASYHTVEYSSEVTIKYILNDADEIAANGGGTKTIVVPAGEYGIKP